MTLKSKFTFRKLLSVFLAVLTVMSIFSVNVYVDFQGSDSTSAGSGTVAGNYHITTVSNDESLVVGYRFSIVDTKGETLKDDNGKFKIIDIIRSSLPGGNSQNIYAYAAGNGTGAGADSHTSMKMKNKRNKYLLALLYKNNPSGINITRVASNASSDTYGITFDRPIQSYPNIGAKTALGYTDTVENWVNVATNRAKLLNALGYSGVTAATVDNVLKRNRIIIEPLVKVEWDGICTLFSAAELAIMNYAYYQKGKSGFTNYGIYAIRRFTNGVYQQSLYVSTNEKNLNMPASAPLALVKPSDIKDLSTSAQNATENLKTYGYILTHTIGMAIYYNKVKEQEANVSLRVRYHTNYNGVDNNVNNGSAMPTVECKINSKNYSSKNGLIASGNTVYQQSLSSSKNANGLVNTGTFGISAPDGYHWNTDENGSKNWLFFSYTKANIAGTSIAERICLKRSEDAAIDSAESLWNEIYHNAGDYWRYRRTADTETAKELSKYSSIQVVDAYPDISVNKIKVVYHLNGGTGIVSSTEKSYTDAVLQISSTKPTRTNFEFIGWSLDEDRGAEDFDKDKNADVDFTSGYYATPINLAKAAGKEADFKKGDITVDLYAVWKGDSLTVKYAPNGGRGKVENQNVDVTKSVTLYDANRVTTNVKKGEIPFTRYGYNLVGWQRKNQTVNITGKYILNDFSLGEKINPAKNLRQYKRLLLGTAYSSATSITLNAVWESKNEKTQINVNVTPNITVPTAFVDKWTNPLGTADTPNIIPAVLYRDGEIIDYVSITLNGNKVTVNGSLESLEYGDYTLKIVSPTDDSYLVGTVNGKQYKGKQIEIPLSCKNISSLTINLELRNYVQTINVSYKTQFNEFDNAEFVTTLTAGTDDNAVTDLYSYKVDGTGKKTIIVPGIIKNAEGDIVACSYSTFMKGTPEYYTPDDSQYDTGVINYQRDNSFNAIFENWYIWDFAVLSAPNVTEVEKGNTFDINIVSTNKRPRANTPKVNIEIKLDSNVIATPGLLI